MTRTRYGSLGAGGLNWDSLPLRLFTGGNAKFWDPADIDFSRDRADWESLCDRELDYATKLCAQFVAGEEAVTKDIHPFMAAMRAEGRLGDEMYLTQFAFEEAKHTQAFRLWLDAVGITDDLHGYLDRRMNELIPLALRLTEEDFALYGDDMPFGLSPDEFMQYSSDKGTRRFGTISSARGRPVEEIDLDYSPVQLENTFADEDQRALAATA